MTKKLDRPLRAGGTGAMLPVSPARPSTAVEDVRGWTAIPMRDPTSSRRRSMANAARRGVKRNQIFRTGRGSSAEPFQADQRVFNARRKPATQLRCCPHCRRLRAGPHRGARAPALPRSHVASRDVEEFLARLTPPPLKSEPIQNCHRSDAAPEPLRSRNTHRASERRRFSGAWWQWGHRVIHRPPPVFVRYGRRRRAGH